MKLFVTLILCAACGATQVQVQPVKIEPIHITVDVNVKDKQASPTGNTADSTQR
jgi:hypothetical protein